MQLCSPLAGLGATGRKVGHAQGAGGDLRVQSILHSPQRIVVFQRNERLPRRADFTFDLCQLVLRSNSPNAYVDAASAAVTDMGGHVAKKLADDLMALFGYPLAHENDVERAARAALSIQRALAELNRKNADMAKPELTGRVDIRIRRLVRAILLTASIMRISLWRQPARAFARSRSARMPPMVGIVSDVVFLSLVHLGKRH